MPLTTSKCYAIHFDPIRAHRACGVPDRYEFAPNRNADYLGVFDLAKGAFIKCIHVGPEPDVTATTMSGRYLYVAGLYLHIIDLETLEIVRTLDSHGCIHNWFALNFFPDGERAFLFNGDGAVAVLRHVEDPVRVEIEKLMRVNAPPTRGGSVGGKGHFTADGRLYYNANWDRHSIIAFDLEHDYAVRDVVTAGLDKPDDLVMLVGDRKGYTASHGSRPGLRGAVHVFDAMAGQVVREITVGRKPAGLALSLDERTLYVTNVPDGSFTAIDTATDEVLYTASAAPQYRAAGVTGDHLDIEGVSVSADGHTLYAYAVNYGALVIFEDIGGANRARYIPGDPR